MNEHQIESICDDDKLCPFHEFLGNWFAKRGASGQGPDDLAAALLMDILWQSKTLAADGAVGYTLAFRDLQHLSLGSEQEIASALRRLAELGLIELVKCCVQGESDSYALVALPWLRDTDEDGE